MSERNDPIRMGVSACLLGQEVRYDGGHKLDRFVRDILGMYVEFVPVCPEVEYGLSIPRESMRLEGSPEAPRLVTHKTRIDHTDGMTRWAKNRVEELAREELCGFVFKSKSPSSGMARVRVYDPNGFPSNSGVGIFARIFMDRFPLLPVEDEGRLNDLGLRENFIERVFVLKRWRDLLKERKNVGGLVDFHTKHKLLLLAHSQGHYREMGKLVAEAKNLDTAELFSRYETLLSTALRLRATPAKHVNVLQHMLGYFKKELTTDEKQEMLDIIISYRKGNVPLIVPITLMNHYVRKYGQPYLGEQIYLNPHPIELKLRNHA
ncbi:MAG: YbgA family protein [Acidobacteriota bacterium]